MSKVILQVSSADGTTKTSELTEHDTFLLGRMEDCHLCVPGDPQVSRHHFLLEACPPMASLRDLGSLNGTHVNGKKCGGREKGETPEQGAIRQYPSVDLKNGDRITVGKSTIEVRLESAPDAAAVPAALQQGDLSGLSPEALRQLIVAVASCHRPSAGRPAPSLIDDLIIHHELGRGGCGAVYLATPKSGGDPVAVKLMLSRAQAEPRAIDQFKREMQVIAGLKHPNIVSFLDSGSDQGTFFFVMEYCDGGSLADVAMARGGTIPPDVLMPWAIQALEGLAAAHKEGFVHRDIKPQNILLHRNRAKISDFGLAKNFQKAGLSGMSMIIYLDTCCLNRPYDDQSQSRIQMETGAVLAILQRVTMGEIQLADSSVLQFEVHRIADQTRRNGILHFLSYASAFQILTPAIEQRGVELNRLGFKRLDALHLAAAEALKVDAMLSTDDQLIRRAFQGLSKGLRQRPSCSRGGFRFG